MNQDKYRKAKEKLELEKDDLQKKVNMLQHKDSQYQVSWIAIHQILLISLHLISLLIYLYYLFVIIIIIVSIYIAWIEEEREIIWEIEREDATIGKWEDVEGI